MSLAFSVVVPTASSRTALARLLPALVALERPRGGFEVIVADDGSSDGTPELAASWADRLAVRVLRGPGFPGRARARELGWRAARGEVVVFLDPDMLVEPTWLLAYQRVLDRGADVVSGGLHAGSISGAIERELPALCSDAEPRVLVALAARCANLAVRRSALELTSGFNVFLRRFDDVELGIRLWEAGARFAYAPEASAVRVAGGAGPEPWMSDDEAAALFWRHPYGDLLRLHAWARRVQTTEGAEGLLAALARPCGGERLRHDLGPAAPGPATWPERDVVAHLAGVHHISLEAMQAHLDRGIARGLYCEERDGVRWFPLDRVEDWVRVATPLLERDYASFHAQELFQGPPDLTPTVLAVRARISIEMDPDLLVTAGIHGINIALPIERGGQRAVKLHGASIPGLLEKAEKAKGMLVGYPVAEVAAAGGSLTLEYSFEIAAPMAGVADGDPAANLGVSMPDEYRARAEAIVREVGPPADPLEAVRAIQEWLEEHVVFGELPPGYPFYRLLDYGTGFCVLQIRLLVALCRLAGIPAREVCGAFLPPGGEGQHEVKKALWLRGRMPFIHSWAEFFVPGRGWLPTEIRGFGRPALLPLTLPDPALRREFEHLIYERYPFGMMHPFRIVCGAQANRLSTLVPPRTCDPLTARRALDAFQCRLECTFTRRKEAAG